MTRQRVSQKSHTATTQQTTQLVTQLVTQRVRVGSLTSSTEPLDSAPRQQREKG